MLIVLIMQVLLLHSYITEVHCRFSHKLRRVMRRAITIGEEQFGFKREDESLCRLTQVVAETLSDAYPELSDQLERIRLILRHEEELFSELQKKVNRLGTDVLVFPFSDFL